MDSGEVSGESTAFLIWKMDRYICSKINCKVIDTRRARSVRSKHSAGLVIHSTKMWRITHTYESHKVAICVADFSSKRLFLLDDAHETSIDRSDSPNNSDDVRHVRILAPETSSPSMKSAINSSFVRTRADTHTRIHL